jgi:hypothetical protein
LKDKAQAFIEFEDINGAEFILNYVKCTPLFFKGLELKISASPRDEITSKYAISIQSDQLYSNNNTRIVNPE